MYYIALPPACLMHRVSSISFQGLKAIFSQPSLFCVWSGGVKLEQPTEKRKKREHKHTHEQTGVHPGETLSINLTGQKRGMEWE